MTVTFGSFLWEVKEKNVNNKQLLSDFIKLINVMYKYNVILNLSLKIVCTVCVV